MKNNNYPPDNPVVFHFRALKPSATSCHSRWPRNGPTPASIAGYPLKGSPSKSIDSCTAA